MQKEWLHMYSLPSWAVWSGAAPFVPNTKEDEPPHDKTNKMAYAPSKGSDQPGHPPSLIRVLAVRMKKHWTLNYLLSAQWRLWSDWADAQADLSFCWVHMPFWWFCHEVAHLSQPMCKGYLSYRRTAKVQVNLCIRAVSPEPWLFTHTIYGTRGSCQAKSRISYISDSLKWLYMRVSSNSNSTMLRSLFS